MTTFGKLNIVNIGQAANSMKLVDDILLTIAGIQNGIADGIRIAVYETHVPYAQIIRELKGMVEDNRPMVVNMLGEGIVKRITDF